MMVVVINVCSRVGEEGNKTLLIVPHGIISLATSQYQMDSFDRENHKKWPPDESCPVGVWKGGEKDPQEGRKPITRLTGEIYLPRQSFPATNPIRTQTPR